MVIDVVVVVVDVVDVVVVVVVVVVIVVVAVVVVVVDVVVAVESKNDKVFKGDSSEGQKVSPKQGRPEEDWRTYTSVVGSLILHGG